MLSSDQHFDTEHLTVRGFPKTTEDYTCPKPLRPAFAAVSRCVDFNTTNIDADVVHCHTWYSQFGGIMAKLNYGLPLVVTVHSLEPLRPWKREQLGGGYDFTCWIEKTAMEMADAVVAVSRETKADILRLFNVDEKRVHIIYNGIDPDEYRVADTSDAILTAHGIDPGKPVRSVRRAHRATKGDHPSRQRHQIPGTGVPGRPVRRSARHTRDRCGDAGGGRGGQARTRRRDLD